MFLLISFVYLGSIHAIKEQGGLGKPAMRKTAMRKTGPNDASCIVWATGMSFFYFLCVLLIFSVLFRFYLHFKTTGWVGLGGDEKNGPKVCVFFLFRVFLILTNIFCFI